MTAVGDWYLEVNGIPLDTHAWRTIGGGYDDLLATPALRGQDLVMPGAQGVRPYERIITQTAVSISLHVFGHVDEDGNPHEGLTRMEGLVTNRDVLRHGLGHGQQVTASFYRGNLEPWTGEVTVMGLQDWRTLGTGVDWGEATCRLDLLIPDGELVEVGS